VEYADWSEQNSLQAPAAGAAAASVFQLVSPLDGDIYRVPPGAERKFATVALRAAGGMGGSAVRWYVDGRPYDGTRWGLERGTHRIRAVSGSGESVEATITVE
jgi:hypothetical protein